MSTQYQPGLLANLLNKDGPQIQPSGGESKPVSDDPHASSNLFSQPTWKQRKTNMANKYDLGGDGVFGDGNME